jgi:HemY protein
MKIRWWVGVLLIVGLIAGPVIKNIPGFVVIAYQQTTIQFPLWLAIFLAILAFLVTSILVIIMMKVFSVTNKAKSWRGTRKWRNARTDTINAMLLFAEGNWSQAEKKMIKAAHNGDTKLINYLVAAQAAQKQSEYGRRDEYLKRAKKVAPKADAAIGLTQARLQMESDQNEQALATLSMLLELEPKNKYINKLFVDVSLKLESWDAVIAKITKLEKEKIYNPEKILEIKRKAICGVLVGLITTKDLEAMQLFWNNLTKKLKKDPVLVQQYCKLLVKQNKHQEAEGLLKKLLKQAPTLAAMKLYSELKTEKPGKQLDFLESLELQNIDQSDYYAALAKVSNTAELWGKSRDYLNRSLLIEDTVKTRAKLANTLVKLGEKDQARQQREKAVKLLEQTNPLE